MLGKRGAALKRSCRHQRLHERILDRIKYKYIKYKYIKYIKYKYVKYKYIKYKQPQRIE